MSRRATVPRECSVEGCDRIVGPHDARGFCSLHYRRWRAHGDPNTVEVILNDDEARFWSYVDRRGDTECWPWTGATGRGGYGRSRRDGGHIYAHRQAYELIVGPIADGLTLDHLCRNTACVNPAHLEPVTLATNLLRSENPWAVNARRAECRNGHRFTEENTRYAPNGTRVCKTCAREASRRHNARRRGDVA